MVPELQISVTPACDAAFMSEHTIERESMAWSAYGGCASADPDLFFPEPGADTAPAREICRSCPVRRMCLDYALETRQKFGIWGGMTENQRRRLRRDRDDHPARTVTKQAAAVPVPVPVDRTTRHLQLVR